MNTKIVSVIDGKITRAEYNSTMGYFVEVTGKAGVKTRYLHLNKILVTKGARVTRGDAIALSGNSGRSSGPHLHYELVINNNPVNSLAFRAAAPADNKLEQHAFGKRAARTVLTGMCYSVGSATRQGSSSLTRFIGQSAMTSRT